jgi:hypothetical protein
MKIALEFSKQVFECMHMLLSFSAENISTVKWKILELRKQKLFTLLFYLS